MGRIARIFACLIAFAGMTLVAAPTASAQGTVAKGKYFAVSADGKVGGQLGTFEASATHLRFFSAGGATAISVDLTQTPIDKEGTVRYGAYEGGGNFGKLIGGGNITPVGIGAGGIVFRIQDLWFAGPMGQQMPQLLPAVVVIITPDAP